MTKKRPSYIVGISGGSGSGKTYIAEKLIDEYQKGIACLISQDSFYKDLSHLSFGERGRQNFDEPSSIDFELFIQVVHTLYKGKGVEIPIYDFSQHIRSSGFQKIKPTPVIILDGTLLFSHPKLIDLINLKVYIDTPDEVRLSRRVRRDIRERDRTYDSVMEQYSNSVRPMFDKHIAPTIKYADIVIDLHKNKNKSIALIKNEIDKNLN